MDDLRFMVLWNHKTVSQKSNNSDLRLCRSSWKLDNQAVDNKLNFNYKRLIENKLYLCRLKNQIFGEKSRA